MVYDIIEKYSEIKMVNYLNTSIIGYPYQAPIMIYIDGTVMKFMK